MNNNECCMTESRRCVADYEKNDERKPFGSKRHIEIGIHDNQWQGRRGKYRSRNAG